MTDRTERQMAGPRRGVAREGRKGMSKEAPS
jgi:hypothetical protein